MLKGFRIFIMRGNVVDLAVAVVIGVAFNAVVSSLVADILTPLIAAIVGKPNFSNLTFTINNSHFHYGLFVNSLISFLAVALAVYAFVVYPLNKLAERRARNKSVAAIVPPDVALLSEIRDLLAQQQPGVAGLRPDGGATGSGATGTGGPASGV